MMGDVVRMADYERRPRESIHCEATIVILPATRLDSMVNADVPFIIWGVDLGREHPHEPA